VTRTRAYDARSALSRESDQTSVDHLILVNFTPRHEGSDPTPTAPRAIDMEDNDQTPNQLR
jgi:hypothetical protein